MSAHNLVTHVFHDDGGVEAGLHGEIAEQTPEESLRVAMYVAAEAPFQGLRADRVSCLQSVANALPQVRLTEGLERLNIAMNPFVVMKGDDPFAIVDKDGRMRLTRNVPREERNQVLAYAVANLDNARKNRISFYLESNQLTAPDDLDLPMLNQETNAMLQGKCVADGLALPMLRTGGAEFPIFDDSETVTIVEGKSNDINPKIYDENLGYGFLLPLSGAFVAGLNDGSITRFSYRVQRNADNALEISVKFTLEGEDITHTTTRGIATYNGAAFAVCSFGQFGAFLLCNDSEVTVSPAEESLVPCFAGNTWYVSRVRGGVRYVSIASKGTSLGVVELPDSPEHHGGHPSVTLAYDLGDTSFAGVFYTDHGNPIPVQFNCAQDVRPLIIATQNNIRMLCDGSWFPVVHNGTARSLSQMFRDVDGNCFGSPAPYMVARPFINKANGYSIDHSTQNGLYAGFKSRGIIQNHAQAIEADAYKGATAAILLLGLHQALQYSDTVNLRLSHPNNPGYRATFEGYINNVRELIYASLTDSNGRGFQFATVEYIDEASCNVAGIYNMGINGQLGTYFVNNIASDMGGSTTDVSVCTHDRKALLPAIPIAGRIVTLQSMIQVARVVDGNGNGLSTILQNVPDGMNTVIGHQIVRTNVLLNQGGDTRTTLEQMVRDPELAEAMQTVLDYFPLNLDQNKSGLLRSLICFKDLLVEDIILRQASRFYTENDFAENPLYLLRLGNGSRCVDLFCGEETPFNHSRDVLRQVLRDRATHLINQNADLHVIHNRNPKTEVTNGLSCYNADNDGAAIERWQDGTTVESTAQLSERYLNEAVQQMKEVANWLMQVVPQICGEIHPLYSFNLQSFSQLLEGLNTNHAFRSVLLNTINHENGRFGNVYCLSASMAVDIWVAFAIMDHVNRELASVQIEVMHG